MVPLNRNYKKKKREELLKQKHRLEARLLRLEAGLPAIGGSQEEIEHELLLVKNELKDLKRPADSKSGTGKSRAKSASKSTGKSNSKTKSVTAAASKKSPLPGGASFPSFQLPRPKNPNFANDSLQTIENLRVFCKKCMGYMQRADQWIDGLHGMSNHLRESGVLPKIMGGKIKDLTGSDWMSVLAALMNSPLSSAILGDNSTDGDKKQASADSKKLEAHEAKAEQADEKRSDKPAKKEQ